MTEVPEPALAFLIIGCVVFAAIIVTIIWRID
jgi:hypothetical protein